ncbi:hypothetical protein POM88_049604 [Heracleum sosnowskyi]|uniref:PI3K/PI4K catalytic domain-containing protein n=1 Tax=Heracleum sosnowskyi TaxID=360622 RepID=A0AAD8GXB6_9APIA|nr:hypothetical protein POM88_049604 [Heracleum sosnowskyi]
MYYVDEKNVELYIKLAELETKKEDTNKKVTVPRDICSIRQIELVLAVTSTFPIEHSCQYHEGSFAHFKGLADSATVMNGINAPKVMEQIFQLVNTFLQNHTDTWKWRLRIRTYKVVPFTPSAGVLEWVNGTVPLGENLIGRNLSGSKDMEVFDYATGILPRMVFGFGLYARFNDTTGVTMIMTDTVTCDFPIHSKESFSIEQRHSGPTTCTSSAVACGIRVMYYRRALKLQAFHDMAKESEFRRSKKDSGRQLFDKTDALDDIVFPPVVTAQWEEQIRRLYLLFTVKESAFDVLINLEARQRVTFFTNSLFMKMPCAPRVRKMLSFSVMTPYYSEQTVYSKSDLEMENEDDVRFLIMDYTGQMLFDCGSEQDGSNCFGGSYIKVQSFKFIPLVYRIASRLGDPKDGQGAQSFQFALVSLLKKMAIDHLYHTVFRSHDMVVMALQVLVVTSIFPIDHSCHYREGSFAHFKGLADSVTVMNGINAPKVVECLGSDGNKYRQLAKSGNDDLRQDAVMEIFFGLVNTFLQNHWDTWKWRLRIRTTYKVVCVTPSAGVLEWVSDTVPLGEYLIRRNCGVKDFKGWLCTCKGRTAEDALLTMVCKIVPSHNFCLAEAGGDMVIVKGMMYYRRALKLQAFHDMAKESGFYRVALSGQRLMRTFVVMCGFILSSWCESLGNSGAKDFEGFICKAMGELSRMVRSFPHHSSFLNTAHKIESKIAVPSDNSCLVKYGVLSLSLLINYFKHAFAIDDFHKSPDLFPVKYADPWKRGTVVLLLQDMFEVVTCDMMVNEICELVEFKHSKKDFGRQLFDKTYALDDFVFPPVLTAQWELGRTVKESAVAVPTNLKSRRRVTFFTNSLFMKMPCAPRVRKMLLFSVMTPYYSEESVYSKSDLEMENEDASPWGFLGRPHTVQNNELVEFKHSKKDSGRQLFDKTYALDDFVFPPVVTAQWEEQIRRLYLLLTVKESAVDVPLCQ